MKKDIKTKAYYKELTESLSRSLKELADDYDAAIEENGELIELVDELVQETIYKLNTIKDVTGTITKFDVLYNVNMINRKIRAKAEVI